MNADTTQSPSATILRELPLTSQDVPALPAIVLDTNVVLDWLLFGDPSVAALAAAITQRRVRWVATALMRSEFAAVLRRGLAAARDVDPDAALAAWGTHVGPCGQPQALPDCVALRCTDADDQMFLDLAHAAGARWLVSRDRAVLRLARRAAAYGIAIMAPERWSARP